MSQDIRNLGTYANIAALWAAHPEGGREGDYATISGTRYRWNKYDRIWENGATVTQTTGTKNHVVEGNQEVTGDVTVLGTLRAKHVKQPHMGMYASEEALLAALPTPEKGWYALVGNELPAELYVCNTAGTWTDTGTTYDGEDVDLTGYVQNDVFQTYTNRGFKIISIASPSTNPSSPTKGDAYLSSNPGTYTNFGNAVVPVGYLAVLKYNGSAWSADLLPVGKDYDAQINQLTAALSPLQAEGIKRETVDISSLGVRNYYIDSTGKYTSSNTYKHSLVPVSPGQSVRVTSNQSHGSNVSFFKTDASPVSGGTPDFSDDYASIFQVVINTGETRDFVVPQDAHYMFIYRGSGSVSPAYPYTPASIVITKPAFNPEQELNGSKTSDYANIKTVADAAFGTDEYNAETLDLSLVATQEYSLGSSGSYQSTGSHGAIRVFPGDILRVTGNGGRASFVSYFTCPSSGTAANAIETITLEIGKEYVLKAPSNAVGFVFNITEGGSSVIPQTITKHTHISKEWGTERVKTSRFSVSNGVLEYGAYPANVNYMYEVKAGCRYAFYIEGIDATVRVYTFNEVPRPSLQVTTLKQLYTTNIPDGKAFFAYVPSVDGYVLFHSYKSGGPSFSVICYDETDVTYPVSNSFDLDESIQFKRINISALTLRSRSISADSGLYGSSTTYKHVLLPVEEGEYVKIVGRSGYTPTLAWFTSDETPSGDGIPPYVSGTTRFTLASGILKVPAGAKYLFVYCGGSPYNSFPAYLGKSVNLISMPDIVKDNDYARTRRILAQMVGQSRSEIDAEYKPLVILHYSDLHGQKECQDRIDQYRNYWKDYIDDTIQTGDILTDKWADEFIFGEEQKDILSVIGNHDTATGTGSSRVWRAKQGLESYKRYIEPFVSNWDVVQPENADTAGYCFFYKDYSESKIRLVVLDSWNDDADYKVAQSSWLTSVLSDARTNGLSVVIASHFRLRAETLLRTPFTKPNAEVESPDSSGNNDPYVVIVKEFKDAGGELVCWICGHAHYDAISKTSEANGSQISVCVGNASRWGSNNNLKITNSMIVTDDEDFKTFDLFNVIAIDTYYKLITILRVGSEWDKYGRHILTTCIKYTTGEVLYP